MKRLWLWFFPLLFLPNLGLSRPTPFGVLELSDFLIGPYLILVIYGLRSTQQLNVGRLSRWLLLFFLWSVISTATIPIRYSYFDNVTFSFCVLKLAKFSLYAFAGVLTARALDSHRTRQLYEWALVAAGITVGVSLFIVGNGQGNQKSEGTGYIAVNAVSVMMAIFLCYFAGRLLTFQNSKRWQTFAKAGLVVMTAGFVLSDGRGGWLAAMAGLAYIFYRVGFSRQVVVFGVLSIVLLGVLYNTQPDFKQQIDMTFVAPNSRKSYQGTRNVGSVDDGGRFENWSREAPKFFDSPLFGTGFFHRGGQSPLQKTGSHSFFIQMFLETGMFGGILVIGVVCVMWKQATVSRGDLNSADIPIKAALVAAVLGGMSGEYFYGGVILLSLFAVYAPIGSLPTNVELSLPSMQRISTHVSRRSPTFNARPVSHS